MNYLIPIYVAIEGIDTGLLYEEYIDIPFSDMDIQRIVECIEKHPGDYMLFDEIPLDLFERIENAISETYDEISSNIREEGYDEEGPWGHIQGVFPAGMLPFIPQELYSKLEMDQLFYHYEVESLEELFAIEKYKAKVVSE